MTGFFVYNWTTKKFEEASTVDMIDLIPVNLRSEYQALLDRGLTKEKAAFTALTYAIGSGDILNTEEGND